MSSSTEEYTEYITTETIVITPIVVFLTSGLGSIAQLAGYSSPWFSLLGAFLAAVLAAWEAIQIRKRIKQRASEIALAYDLVLF